MPLPPIPAKTPSATRTLLVLLALASTGTARAQSAVTEAVVADAAGARALAVLTAEVRAARARAEAENAALHPNPSLEWEHQEAFAPNAQTQDLLWARIPIDFSGRRRAERELARLDAAEAEAEAEALRIVAVADGLSLFYRALGAERRVAVLEETQAALDEAARIARSREAAGDASGYVAARLHLEASLERSSLEEARVEAEALRARLVGGLNLPDGPLEGDFEVRLPAFDASVETRPEARAARAMAEGAAAARRASRSGWIPRLGVSGAYNRQAQEGAVGHGYGAGVEIELPFFDHGQREAAEAEAAEATLAAQGEVLGDVLGAELAAAHARLAGLLAERGRLEETRAAAETVVRAAEAGFREGERSLVEWLDARRAARAVHERLLGLDVAVRLADLEYRRAGGDLR